MVPPPRPIVNAHLRKNAIQFRTLAPSLPYSKHSRPNVHSEMPDWRSGGIVSGSRSGACYTQQISRVNFCRGGDHETSRFSSISRHRIGKPRVPKDGALVFTSCRAGSLAHFPTDNTCRSIEDIRDDA